MVDPKITFGDFIALARSKGVKDSTELTWIDFAGQDEIRFNIYDSGLSVTIVGMIKWDKADDDTEK